MVKGVGIITDVVKEEGLAMNKKWPRRLPLGPDTLDALRKMSEKDLAIYNEWKGVIGSTKFVGVSGVMEIGAQAPGAL